MGEQTVSPLPFLVHKHPDRALVLATNACFCSCRFCFRRGSPLHAGPGPGGSDWEDIFHWLHHHREVGEVILSGGDPLHLGDREMEAVGKRLARIPHIQRWRIHTRAPVVQPERVSPGLLRALDTRLPLRVVIHVNHAGELTPPVGGALARIRRSGFAVLSQSVLLAGVNDEAGALSTLFRRLHDWDVAPRYLHHPDRAPGTRRFRISIRRGSELVRKTEQQAEGPVPPYVLDLPNGAGKCLVEDLRVVAAAVSGRTRRYRYRWVRPPDWRAAVQDRRFEWWDIAEAL